MNTLDIERFETFIEKCSDGSTCWNWLSAKNKKGYGSFSLDGKSQKATHISYKLYNKKEIRPGLFILHTCDNPSCVNPEHLYEGTNAQNMLDMWSRGRRKRKQNPTCHPSRIHAGLGLCVACYKQKKRGLKFCVVCGVQLPKYRAKVCSDICRHERAMAKQRERRKDL